MVGVSGPLCSIGDGKKNAVGLDLAMRLCPSTVLLKILFGLFLSHPRFVIGGKQTPLSLQCVPAGIPAVSQRDALDTRQYFSVCHISPAH